jgi:DNA polymerase I-like protein with 3'-5' exonuclease and polymerase domains
VQGFATADIVPIACINAYKMMRYSNVKSLLINTVHDSIVVDAHPDEIGAMTKILNRATRNVIDSLYEFYKVEFNVPLDTELKIGDNWLEMQEIPTKIDKVVL